MPPKKKNSIVIQDLSSWFAVTDIERSSFAHGLNYSPTCSGMAWQYMGFDCWGWECTTTLTHELCSWQVKTWRNHWNSGCILGAATFQFFIVLFMKQQQLLLFCWVIILILLIISKGVAAQCAVWECGLSSFQADPNGLCMPTCFASNGLQSGWKQKI